MVTIINFKERQREDGTSFFILEVQGGIEMVKSKATGKFYATAKKASLSSTFDAQTCQSLIGTQMDGYIQKVSCEPFEFTVAATGEIITLSHRYTYVQELELEPIQQSLKPNVEAFSRNGKHQLEHA